MAQSIHFKCRGCENEILFESGRAPICGACQRPFTVKLEEVLTGDGLLRRCAVCGHDALYLQKDFNRGAGIAIVAVGAALSLYFFAGSEPLYAMAVLAGTALVDWLLYQIVSHVTVCYSCHAIYRGFISNPEHEFFDLKQLEKYGGRNPRW